MQKDMLVNMGVKVFQALAAGYSQEELEEADNKLYSEIGDIIKHARIPILTNDEEVKKYIKEFDLQRLDNLCCFFVESYYASLENISSAINGLQQENLIMVLGKIRGAKNQITIGINNPEEGREYLRQAQGAVLEACGTLEGLLQGYICRINEIDQKSKWQFFKGAKGALSKIDMNVSCARTAIEALNTAIRLQALIAIQLNQKSKAVIIEHIDDIRNILSDEGCDLLQAYDKNKQDGYWKRVPQKFVELEKIGNTLDEYLEIGQQNGTSVGQLERKGGFFRRWKKQVNDGW